MTHTTTKKNRRAGADRRSKATRTTGRGYTPTPADLSDRRDPTVQRIVAKLYGHDDDGWGDGGDEQ